MLQQILKDMYIDPEMLDALNEDQKKTLFLKMRQEQVRRWKEREEKLEREGGDAEHRRTKPKKANSKNVSWLLGRDGDVAVIVIGEVDELSSKFICSGLGEKKAQSLQNNTYHRTILKGKKTTEAVRTERENLPPKAQPGISLNLKGKREETSTLLPLPVSVSEQSSPPAAEKQAEPKPAAVAEEKPAPQPAACSRPPMRTSPVNVRPACANVVPGSVNARPGFANLRQAAAVVTTAAISTAAISTAAAATATAAPSPATPSPAAPSPAAPSPATQSPTAPSLAPSGATKTDSGTTSFVKGGANSLEPPNPRDTQGVRDTAASEASRRAASEEAGSSGRPAACAGRGRVAQLMKTFSTESSSAPAHTPSRGVKPPLPTKPSHLRTATTPSVR